MIRDALTLLLLSLLVFVLAVFAAESAIQLARTVASLF